ncbi:DUF262 domain-containing protein [Archangium violaceum]|uniref:DUF262 domain-containing protein n=1 Tax=Archangium violaceum TaxID=83451 RepID=UPI002B2926D3|nr:DUF262 domain-containing protein [Archangium gephyra]
MPTKRAQTKKPKKDHKPSKAIFLEAAVEDWNSEDAAELRESIKDSSIKDISVFSRDWTVETIVNQIRLGNIDLDPDFQRRNAWHDERRSKLIESFVLGFPVPQIVLAENPQKKKSFIVIDGKQRLMTIAGFYLKEYRSYWDKPRMQGLKILERLNKIDIDTFLEEAKYGDDRRQLSNADIRTTVISGFHDEGLLYDIFYRLNTGSVPLSSQELRQVLHRGDFSKFLVQVTNDPNPLWKVLNLNRPDPRLRDIELLLRLIAISVFSSQYKGNLKQFLDVSTKRLNQEWDKKSAQIKTLTNEIFAATEALSEIFDDNVGKKYSEDNGYESRINRAIFEVQSFYLQQSSVRKLAIKRKTNVVRAFEKLCTENPEFMSSVEATTKSVENYKIRFKTYGDAMEKAIGQKLIRPNL